MIRLSLGGFGNGDDTATFVDSSFGVVNLGAGNDTVSVSGVERSPGSNTDTLWRIDGSHGGGDTLNLPVGTVVVDGRNGTFTVQEGQEYTIRAGTATLPNGQVIRYRRFEGGEQFEAPVVCFCQDTTIATAEGARAVQDLKVGDLILTAEGEALPLRWMGQRTIDRIDLLANEKLRPVRITAGALGCGLPEKDLLVSRQHRMLVRSVIAERMFDTEEVLIPAIKLTALPGIFVDTSVNEVTYFHLLLDEHSVIIAEGSPAESLATGPNALKALSPEAREEIKALFPEVFEEGFEVAFARPVPEGRKQRELVERHLKNDRAVLMH